MQTVNFQCGQCGKLMAVSVEFLGQQVRCPHCQQVVVAPNPTGASPFTPPTPAPPPTPDPPPTPAPPPEPSFRPLEFERHDDIFSHRFEPEDALFGGEGPRMEIPREPAAPAPVAPAPLMERPPEQAPADLPLETTQLPVSPAGGEGMATVSLSSPPPAGEATLAAPPALVPTPWSPIDTSPAPEAISPEAPSEVPMPTPTVRRPRSDAGRINWFIPLVFIPLILYALIATAAAAMLYLRVQTKPPSIFEQMPDIDGDTPGVRKGKVQAKLSWDRATATARLPEHLKVKLGETIRLGDLEVKPLSVKRQKVGVFVEGLADRAEPCENDSLVLTMEMTNRSDDYAFTPLDNYFDRWVQAPDATLTVLVAGQSKFYGGAARWYPLKRSREARDARQWVDLPGRKNVDEDGLAPGKTATMAICTDGGSADRPPPPVVARLFGRNAYSGDLLWRVHVRRGVITQNKRRYPAAAVIGVEFTTKEIQ